MEKKHKTKKIIKELRESLKDTWNTEGHTLSKKSESEQQTKKPQPTPIYTFGLAS